MAPLATPVVPPVYWRKARSSRSRATGFGAFSPPASACLKDRHCGSRKGGTCFFTWRTTKLTIQDFGAGRRSPIALTTTVSTLLPPIACCNTLAKFSSTMTTRAPESASWMGQLARRVERMALTTTAPARSAAKSATGYWSRLGIMIAIRSPFSMPASCWSQEARRRLIASSSP